MNTLNDGGVMKKALSFWGAILIFAILISIGLVAAPFVSDWVPAALGGVAYCIAYSSGKYAERHWPEVK